MDFQTKLSFTDENYDQALHTKKPTHLCAEVGFLDSTTAI